MTRRAFVLFVFPGRRHKRLTSIRSRPITLFLPDGRRFMPRARRRCANAPRARKNFRRAPRETHGVTGSGPYSMNIQVALLTARRADLIIRFVRIEPPP